MVSKMYPFKVLMNIQGVETSKWESHVGWVLINKCIFKSRTSWKQCHVQQLERQPDLSHALKKRYCIYILGYPRVQNPMHHIHERFLLIFTSCLQVFLPEAYPTAPARYIPYSSSQILRIRVKLLSLFQSSIEIEVWEKPESSKERLCAYAVTNLPNPRMVNKTRSHSHEHA